MTSISQERSKTLNQAEVKLWAAIDYLAATLEKPDERVWEHFMVYIPDDMVAKRADRIIEKLELEAIDAHVKGYMEAMELCERADVAKLLLKITFLEGSLVFEKARRTVAERKNEQQAARIAGLEDQFRARRGP